VSDGITASLSAVESVNIYPPKCYSTVGVVNNFYTAAAFLNQPRIYSFSNYFATPALPPGLAFKPTDALGDLVFEWTPTTANTYTFTITTDYSYSYPNPNPPPANITGSGTTPPASYTITIYPAIDVPLPPSNNNVTETYGISSPQVITATGGTPGGYTFQ